MTLRTWAGIWMRERAGLLPLAATVLFLAIAGAPEISINRVPVNDLSFHLAGAERLGASLVRHEPFLDPWVSEWALGYPVWRSYQPLPHLMAAGFLGALSPFTSHAAAFGFLNYLLLVGLPISIYAGARGLGLSPLAAGLSSLLALTPSESGDFGRYGLGLGAFLWRGSGLYTQLVAFHFLSLGLGAAARTLETGRRRARAAVLLAATALSHIVFGYVIFLSAFLLAVTAARPEIGRRLARFASMVALSLILLVWFLVPLFLGRAAINHSRWEDPQKWDSYGARVILNELVRGRMFDSGRAPLLTILLALGVAAIVLFRRDMTGRRLLVLGGAWLTLFFGRVTWGRLLALAAVPNDLPTHRLEGAFELFAVLIAGWGLAAIGSALWRSLRPAGAVFGALALAGLVWIGIDRAHYFRDNAAWGEANLAAYAAERDDLDSAIVCVRQILAETPGRVSAGLAAGWGHQFKIGEAPVFSFLTAEHLDEVSFLYHSMSLPSDVMVLRQEDDPQSDAVFGVRAVIAPQDWKPPASFTTRGRFGRFRVYEAQPDGYFGLVDLGGRDTSPPVADYDVNSAWLGSQWMRAGVVAILRDPAPGLPTFRRWEQFPPMRPEVLTPRGRIVSQTRDGEIYRARVELARDCAVTLKISWDPFLSARVDGRPARLLQVTPGFVAVPMPAGIHDIEVRYRPGPLRAILFVAGIFLFPAAALWLRSHPERESQAAGAAARWVEIASRRRVLAVAAVGIAAVVALHSLFQGRLIDGHDGSEYMPRLVEFRAALAGGDIPPLWAPDLSNGYGQPLFEFAPPLAYAAALPFATAGFGLADSIQLGLVVLFLIGAAAVYSLCRKLMLSRLASVGGAVFWLFAPYVSLDLFVRATFMECAAVAMCPVAVWGVVTALESPRLGKIVVGAAAASLVVLAHNAIALLLFVALGLVVLFARGRRGWLPGGGVLAGALALSAFFWLPAMVEKSFVQTDLLRRDFLSWSVHILEPWQLLFGRWGYGVSVAGPDDGMSFAIGWPLLLLGLGGVLVVFRRRPELRGYALAFLLASAGGAWLAVRWSSRVWERFETLQYMAYPWRTLFLPATFLPLLAAVGVGALARRSRPLALAAIGLVAVLNFGHLAPSGYLKFDDEFYEPGQIASKGMNTTTREEYTPRWSGFRAPYTEAGLMGSGGGLRVTKLRERASHRSYRVESDRDQLVEAALLYYPGWAARIDSHPAEISPMSGRGTITFELPAGSHRVDLDLRDTPVRRAGKGISIAALAAGLAAIGIGRVRR